MKTIFIMALATMLFVAAQVVQAHPVFVTPQECRNDYYADWESKECQLLLEEARRDAEYDYDRDEYDEWEMIGELP